MRPGIPQYVLAFVVAGLLLGVLWAGSTSTAAFGGYNPAWDGSSEARVLADDVGDVAILRSTEPYDGLDRAATTAVVLSPERRYSDDSAERVRSFVRDGGTVVVAGDFDDAANPLLESVGVESRIDGRALRDERHHGATPAMPVATNVTDRPETRSVNRLALNYPSVVEPGPNASVVARSSPFSYLDANENEELDETEQLRSYPVIVVERVGEGRVVVVSDPSVFINAMLEREDNRAFARNLFEDETVAFDYSHRGEVPPLRVLVLELRASALAQLAVGIGLVVGAALLLADSTPLGTLRDRFAPGRNRMDAPGISDAEVTAFVREQYPEWDEEDVERLSQSITLRSQNDESER